ncbi:MAG TPA: PmoA family protein [Vicinamibacterales bacterium]|nr:PmoA family protein [Vicinamibacterales bacterium]
MRWAFVAIVAAAVAVLPLRAANGVEVKVNEAARRVDVTIDGKPFTSYIWPTTLKKPVLYPLRSARGTLVTRGFPLDPRNGERVDHPHHVGLWLNHGDVNGFDFWNNSDAIPAKQAPKMGTIVHRKILDTKSGADKGELAVETAWMTPDNTQLIKESTRFVFRGGADSRTIDRITTLTALDQKVVFKDNKEAMFGMRVARGLEQPADKPEVFTDASGKATAVPVLDNTGVTGKYVSSEGKEGDAVWGTRGKWTMLGGKVEGEPVTIAILDHPSNPGYPTHWHARGYGLFAANPLGDEVFKEKPFNLTLEPGKSVTFRYRVLILGGPSTPDRIERESQAFAQEGSKATGNR